MVKETRFMKFWRALVVECEANGIEEPTCGSAWRLFKIMKAVA